MLNLIKNWTILILSIQILERMSRSIELASRFKEVMLNGKWIANTNYFELLEAIDWQTANRKVENLNSVAALTAHINYYISGVLQVLEGGKLEISDKYSFDFPLLTSEADWMQLLLKLRTNSLHFAMALEQMPDTKLDTVFVDPRYGTYERNINGMIEHAYYHLGQVRLITKLLS